MQKEEVCFYGNNDYNGWEACFKPGQYRNVNYLNIPDNEIGSVSVSDGLKLDMYQDIEFSGRRISENNNKRHYDVINDIPGWNKRIGSFEISRSETPKDGINDTNTYGNILKDINEDLLETQSKHVIKKNKLYETNPQTNNSKNISVNNFPIEKLKKHKKKIFQDNNDKITEIEISNDNIKNIPFNKNILCIVLLVMIFLCYLSGRMQKEGLLLGLLIIVIYFVGLK